jgi:flagellar protein FlbT
MTLCISLRDGEKMIVNGAVMRASGRVELAVENRVSILRGREVMNPAEATSPARLLYLACMMAYVDEGGRDVHHDRLIALLGELTAAFHAPAAHMACLEFARLVALGDHYRALGICRTIIEHETAALARMPAMAD